MATSDGTVCPALNLIWNRWNGIKHVWEANGWPFLNNHDLNDQIVLTGAKVVYIRRRNLLQRAISSIVSKHLRFWVGSREEFFARLEATQLPMIDPRLAAECVSKDHAADERRWELLKNKGIPSFLLYYEDLFGPEIQSRTQFNIINSILIFLGIESLDPHEFKRSWQPLLNTDVYKWSTAEVYRMIPGVQLIEEQCGSDETGWLFNTGSQVAESRRTW